MNRRALLATSCIVIPLISVGCTTGTSVSPALVSQFIADAQGVITAISGVLNNAANLIPAATMATLKSDLAAAEAGLTALEGAVSSITTSGASTAQNVYNLLLGVVQAAMAALSTVSGAGSILGILQTAYDVLPGIWTFVSGLISGSTPAPATASLRLYAANPVILRHIYLVPQARGLLAIPTYK